MLKDRLQYFFNVYFIFEGGESMSRGRAERHRERERERERGSKVEIPMCGPKSRTVRS